MAYVTSKADGYFNEAGVLSTVAGQNFGAASCIIKNTVMLGNGAIFSAAKLYMSTTTGAIGIDEGLPATLVLGGASTLKFVSVGSVVQPVVPAIGANSTSPSIPSGQH